MNTTRRQAIAAELDTLALPDYAGTISALEALRDEEQEYLDNMPEAFQNGDKGQAAEQAINSLAAAIDALESVTDSLSEVQDALAEAQA